MDVLLTKQSGSGTNRGFRTIDNQVQTYLKKELGSPTFTQKGKSWQMRSLQYHQRFHVRGTLCIQPMYIVEEKKTSEKLISRKKIKKSKCRLYLQSQSQAWINAEWPFGLNVSNQQPGNLTNEMTESSIHQQIRTQEKEPIRKQDTKRNNQWTPSIQSLHSMKSRDSYFIRHVT